MPGKGWTRDVNRQKLGTEKKRKTHFQKDDTKQDRITKILERMKKIEREKISAL